MADLFVQFRPYAADLLLQETRTGRLLVVEPHVEALTAGLAGCGRTELVCLDQALCTFFSRRELNSSIEPDCCFAPGCASRQVSIRAASGDDGADLSPDDAAGFSLRPGQSLRNDTHTRFDESCRCRRLLRTACSQSLPLRVGAFHAGQEVGGGGAVHDPLAGFGKAVSVRNGGEYR